MRHDLRADFAATSGERDRPRILFLAQLPPPYHGQTMMAQTVLDILSDEFGCKVTHLWAGSAAKAEDIGKRSLGKYFAFAGLLARLGGMALTGRRFEIAYLGTAPWAHTAMRDALVAGASKLLAKRVCVHVHGVGLEKLVSSPGARGWLLRKLYAGTEIIAMTAGITGEANRAGLFTRILDLPNLANDPGTPRQRQRDELVVSCLGNLDPRKGVLDFVDVIEAAVRKGRRVRGVIVGGPTAQLSVEELRRRVAERGLADAITVTGRVDEATKSDILADSDVFLYLSRHDLAPLALIEAMAHGCVPLVLDTGGIREIAGTALADNVMDLDLVGKPLVDACLGRVEAYLDNPVALQNGRLAARKRFLENYSPEAFRLRLRALVTAR